MDHDAFLQLLQISDPQAFVDRVVGAIGDAYRFNADRYEEDLDDLQVFGFSVYRNGWHLIEREVEDIPGVLTARPKNSLEITVAQEVRFHVYRGGNDETYDIYSYDLTNGTPTKASLPHSNSLQLSLFDALQPDGDNLARLSELVIVHAGNPEDGLTGVWVGAPLEAAGWAWVLPLFHLERPEDGAATTEDDADIVPFDSRKAPDLEIALHGTSADTANGK
jgi:hypothetical protein